MNALVTGGAGFIGSNITRALLDRGGDMRSYERVSTAVRDVDVVFHQGALPSVPRSIQDPLTSNAANVEGTLNVLLAARDSGVRRVVFASSSSVYGSVPDLPKREDLPTL